MTNNWRRFWSFFKEGRRKRRLFIGGRLGQWRSWPAFLKSCWWISGQPMGSSKKSPAVLEIRDPKWTNFVYGGPMLNLGKARHQKEKEDYRESGFDMERDQRSLAVNRVAAQLKRLV